MIYKKKSIETMFIQNGIFKFRFPITENLSSFSNESMCESRFFSASREAKREFPSKLNEWETRTNSFESKIDRPKVDRRSERGTKNCHYSNTTSGQLREESAREEHRHLQKTERSHRDRFPMNFHFYLYQIINFVKIC